MPHKRKTPTLAKNYRDNGKFTTGPGGWYCGCCNPCGCHPRNMKMIAHRWLRRKMRQANLLEQD